MIDEPDKADNDAKTCKVEGQCSSTEKELMQREIDELKEQIRTLSSTMSASRRLKLQRLKDYIFIHPVVNKEDVMHHLCVNSREAILLLESLVGDEYYLIKGSGDRKTTLIYLPTASEIIKGAYRLLTRMNIGDSMTMEEMTQYLNEPSENVRGYTRILIKLIGGFAWHDKSFFRKC